mmetsp:Transcript_10210/g.34040  ORF Transcript_10210/g.34040 Transcript_10210/m.34040 type:complete len:116 (-) Transcript_10210:28-375(-)
MKAATSIETSFGRHLPDHLVFYKSSSQHLTHRWLNLPPTDQHMSEKLKCEQQRHAEQKQARTTRRKQELRMVKPNRSAFDGANARASNKTLIWIIKIIHTIKPKAFRCSPSIIPS